MILLKTNGNRALNQSSNVRNVVSIVPPLIRPFLGNLVSSMRAKVRMEQIEFVGRRVGESFRVADLEHARWIGTVYYRNMCCK